jgi:hypothetical protein
MKGSIVFKANHSMERLKKFICFNELNVLEFIFVSYIIYTFCRDNPSSL